MRASVCEKLWAVVVKAQAIIAYAVEKTYLDSIAVLYNRLI